MLNSLPVINALWIGEKLGEISKCCLNSFVLRGHPVHLYTYAKIEDVPVGVQCCDANEIIPESQIIKHNETGSYALFSDIFRYELMRKEKGIYVDCDVYCLKTITVPESGYLLGFEDDNAINGAILRLPKDTILLNDLLDAAYNPLFIPPWYSKNKQLRFKIKKLLGIGRSIADMPWGSIGPKAITYYAKKANILNNVQPIDVFYPVHYQCVSQFCDPNLTIDDITTSRTSCVHIYNEMFRGIDLSTLDKNCILSKFFRNEI